MFGKRITIFRILGFKVNIDPSWLLIVVLITWSLARGAFPYYYKGFTQHIYWWMGFAGAMGLFLSIIFHELCHSLIARRFGMPMRGITLFVFGGVAEMEEEPPSAKAEFFMAIAGPLASIFLGCLLWGLFALIRGEGGLTPAVAVINYLSVINFILAGFNLLPAFPLDGGRVLRSILWGLGHNIRKATRISSQIGAAFSVMFMTLGILFFITGAFISGLWWFLIGIFLRGAAQVSYRRLLVQENLKGEPVSRFMKEDPVTVKPAYTLEKLVEDYVYKFHYKMFPVVDGDKLIGCVEIQQIKTMPRDEWGNHTVGEIMRSCSEANTLSPDTDAMDALIRMNRTKRSRFMIAEGDKIRGILTLRDLLQFLSLKLDLEGEDQESPHDLFGKTT